MSTPKIYDDLFSHLLCFASLYCLTSDNIYGPFLYEKALFQKKKSFMTPFLFSLYFHTHPITLLLDILGGRMHGPFPTKNFGGTVPQSSLGLRPCSLGMDNRSLRFRPYDVIAWKIIGTAEKTFLTLYYRVPKLLKHRVNLHMR